MKLFITIGDVIVIALFYVFGLRSFSIDFKIFHLSRTGKNHEFDVIIDTRAGAGKSAITLA